VGVRVEYTVVNRLLYVDSANTVVSTAKKIGGTVVGLNCVSWVMGVNGVLGAEFQRTVFTYGQLW
jgi:hypothetical protein